MPRHAVRAAPARGQVAAPLARAPHVPSRDRRRAAQVLRARHVPLPVGRGPARRPPRGLHRDRHHRALQAHAGLQRAAPDGLGRLRPARRAVRDQDRRAPARSPPRSNIATFRAPDRVARLLLRLGPRGRHHRSRLLQVDAVDLPAALRARPRLRGRGAGQLVPGAQAPVLANEEVSDGTLRARRHPVDAAADAQWMLRITAYADRLLEDLDELDWPEPTKEMQRELDRPQRGRARSCFPVDGPRGRAIEVFTTRPDTLFGATYMVLAPEHPLVDAAHDAGAARGGRRRTGGGRARKSELERTDLAEGQDRRLHRRATRSTRSTASAIPIWIADYVLAGYGTGAIMAVPGARRARLRVREEVRPADRRGRAAGGDVAAGGAVRRRRRRGQLAASSTACRPPRPRTKMIAWLEEQRRRQARASSYKLRDWLFSRQRYWGEPFPLVHCPTDGTSSRCPRRELPVRAARASSDYEPTRRPASRRSRARPSWVETTDPETRPARRGARPTRCRSGRARAGTTCASSTRRNDASALVDPRPRSYWMPVDLYVGGAEHAVLHLLYARFWHKVLFDLGLVHTKEPFQKLLHQGMILGKSYRYFRRRLRRPGVAQLLLARRRALRRRDTGPSSARARSSPRSAGSPPDQVRWKRRRGRSRRAVDVGLEEVDREDVQEPRQRGEPRRGDRRVRRRRDAPLRDVHRAARPGRAVVDRRRARRLALPAAARIGW